MSLICVDSFICMPHKKHWVFRSWSYQCTVNGWKVFVFNSEDSRGSNNAINYPAQKKLCPEMYHYFMKIPYPKFLFIIKSVSLITVIWVIVVVLGGYVRHKLLLTAPDFNFCCKNITFFNSLLFLRDIFELYIYGGSH